MSPLSAPFFWSTQEREAAAPKPSDSISGGAQEIFAGFFKDFLGGDGKAEGAKERGAGIWPEAVPKKMSSRKKGSLLNRENRCGIGRARRAGKAEQRKSGMRRSSQVQNAARFEWLLRR